MCWHRWPPSCQQAWSWPPPDGDIRAWPWPNPMEVSGGQDSGPPFPIGLDPSLRFCRKVPVSHLVAPLPQGADGSEPWQEFSALSSYFFLKCYLKVFSRLKTARKELRNEKKLFSPLCVKKACTLFCLVIAKPFRVPACFNRWTESNIALIIILFVCLLLFIPLSRCFPATSGIGFPPGAPQDGSRSLGESWLLQPFAGFCSCFDSFTVFVFFLCFFLEDFSSAVVVIKGKQVMSYLGWEKMRAREKEAQV